MFVCSGCLREVATYLDGFCHGLESATGRNPLRGWGTWIETKYLISDPAWHWTAILRHSFGSDSAALKALPGLFASFKVETTGLSDKELDELHRAAFVESFGVDHHRPGDPPNH